MSRGEIVGLNADTALAAALYSAKHQLPIADSIILLTAWEHQAILWMQDVDLKGHKGVKYKAKTA
jgi:predicted nucleic acid-binding protein